MRNCPSNWAAQHDGGKYPSMYFCGEDLGADYKKWRAWKHCSLFFPVSLPLGAQVPGPASPGDSIVWECSWCPSLNTALASLARSSAGTGSVGAGSRMAR